jgi:serine/threonine protein phosphatase PrpC
MHKATACSNRLGNRPSNQDRCLVLERRGQVLLAVADGMGGHARGDLAAQTAIDSLARSFAAQCGPVDTPQSFLQRALEAAHLDVIDAGEASEPGLRPRTTCVVCLVQGDQAFWAHSGDSRLYLLRQGKLLRRTRDHTPVEQLLHSGLIDEQEMRHHPLRNSVSRCLGGRPTACNCSFDHARLEPDDMLLLCSDGLWSALPERRLTATAPRPDLGGVLERLCDEAERASYPRSDNISAVALHWISACERQAPPAGRLHSHRESRQQAKDPLQRAIDDIHRAILDYAAEMKKP